MSVHVNTAHCTREEVGSHCAFARVLSCAHVGQATGSRVIAEGCGLPFQARACSRLQIWHSVRHQIHGSNGESHREHLLSPHNHKSSLLVNAPILMCTCCNNWALGSCTLRAWSSVLCEKHHSIVHCAQHQLCVAHLHCTNTLVAKHSCEGTSIPNVDMDRARTRRKLQLSKKSVQIL